MSLTVTPRGSRVLVRRDDAHGISAGGIIIPDGAKDKPQRGTVVAIGPGALNQVGCRNPIEGIRVGDSVLFTKYSGDAFRIVGEKEEIFLVDEKDVIAVLSDPEDEEEEDELLFEICDA